MSSTELPRLVREITAHEAMRAQTSFFCSPDVVGVICASNVLMQCADASIKHSSKARTLSGSDNGGTLMHEVARAVSLAHGWPPLWTGD